MFFGFLLSEALLSEPRFTGFKDLPDLPEQQERSSTDALPSVCYAYFTFIRINERFGLNYRGNPLIGGIGVLTIFQQRSSL